MECRRDIGGDVDREAARQGRVRVRTGVPGWAGKRETLSDAFRVYVIDARVLTSVFMMTIMTNTSLLMEGRRDGGDDVVIGVMNVNERHE